MPSGYGVVAQVLSVDSLKFAAPAKSEFWFVSLFSGSAYLTWKQVKEKYLGVDFVRNVRV